MLWHPCAQCCVPRYSGYLLTVKKRKHKLIMDMHGPRVFYSTKKEFSLKKGEYFFSWRFITTLRGANVGPTSKIRAVTTIVLLI